MAFVVYNSNSRSANSLARVINLFHQSLLRCRAPTSDRFLSFDVGLELLTSASSSLDVGCSMLSVGRFPLLLPRLGDSFTEFELQGWERVADKYNLVWSSSTRQFIPPLLDTTEVFAGMSVLDVGCGPGYVSDAAAERGATSTGLDFSKEMVAIAK